MGVSLGARAPRVELRRRVTGGLNSTQRYKQGFLWPGSTARLRDGAMNKGAAMKRFLSVLISALLVATPASAWAPGTLKVVDLLALCSSASEVDRMACHQYIMGAADAASIGGGLPNSPIAFCTSNEITSADLETDVKERMTKLAHDKPEYRVKSAVAIIISLLIVSYPCPK